MSTLAPSSGSITDTCSSVHLDAKILILGLGNTLLTDEGAGVYAVRQLAKQQALYTDIECIDGGTLGFALAGALACVRALIVIDTAALDAPPGSILVFEGEQMDHFITTGKKSSVHEVSLQDLLAITLLEGNLPARRALVGIQPAHIGWGDAPTPDVVTGIEHACEAATQILQRWRHEFA